MESKKRVDVVSIKVVKDYSIQYTPRKVSNPRDAYKLFEKFLLDIDREKFLVACFNTKNEPVNISVVSIGTLNSSLVHPREVMKTAILSNSNSIMIAHNHPSGGLESSTEDKNITDRLIKACEILGIKLLDHIIIGSNDSYFSFKENLLM
ncbi:TPA: JAB domain-containing protein [Clostridioides difficile]|uniref:JAB domain-containing protein n=1 Tax=Clostridioides difficile TaxID=1496 RepID=UPI000B3CC469|nr:JAB domain-containing protein [Clostridioides difficile]MEC5403317.1 JAB domain-containing protein [Clostridioides difficile]TLE39797.1 DNA repair protein RadC [Clostridioides difficile]HBE9333767.1 JAB domain-containing protein [Clostridioides difficile]